MRTKLRTYFSGEDFAKSRENIKETGVATILRTKDDEPFGLSREQVDEILHEYAPELSAAVSGSVIVIFLERQQK